MFIERVFSSFVFLMIRRQPKSTRMTHSFPTRRSSDLRFAYIVSRDLRSPLVNVMGFTSELQALRKYLFPGLEAEAGATKRQPAEPGPGQDPGQDEARATQIGRAHV